jgi:hypothetical protein
MGRMKEMAEDRQPDDLEQCEWDHYQQLLKADPGYASWCEQRDFERFLKEEANEHDS